MNLEEIKVFWPMLITFVAVGSWFIRLEAKVLYLGKDHEKLEVIVKEKDALLWEKFNQMQVSMNNILQSVARIEGALNQRNRDEKTM